MSCAQCWLLPPNAGLGWAQRAAAGGLALALAVGVGRGGGSVQALKHVFELSMLQKGLRC